MQERKINILEYLPDFTTVGDILQVTDTSKVSVNDFDLIITKIKCITNKRINKSFEQQ